MRFINRRFIWLILSLFIFSFQVKAQEKVFDESVLSGQGRTAYQRLLKIELFALGPTSSSAQASDGELALDILMKEKEAIPFLESLIENATPEGGLYALFGLRKLKSSTIEKYLKDFKSKPELDERGEDFNKIPKAKVKRMDGCELFIENRTKVADEIAAGKYDAWLSEEWTKLKEL